MVPPSLLGAPARFGAWRPQQEEAIDKILGNPKRFDGARLPTGVGKSLLAWGTAQLYGARTIILTSTKPLMDQYERDFEEVGLRDIRGMNNYPCRALSNRERCDVGPCLDGEECIWREAGCSYFDRVSEARNTQVIVSNYAYWFSHPDEGTLGPRDLLIADEAHAIPEEVAEAAGAEINSKEIELEDEMEGWTLDQWRAWAEIKYQAVVSVLRRSTGLSANERRDLRNLMGRLFKIARSGEEEWAWEWSRYGGVSKARFEPLEAKRYAEGLLFRHIPRVILMSATMTPQTFDELGVEKEAYNFFETGSPFPVANRPIYWLETGVRVTGKTSDTNLRFWAAKIDQAIAPRLGTKGLIHTVSYSRARWLKENSVYGKYMVIHNSQNTRETVERFRNRSAPSILVSPSVHTGYDFPYDAARWQVIAKVPFPDTRFGIAKAKQERDEKYSVKKAIASIQQMAGRVNRSETDKGETIIVDDSMRWLYSYHRPWFAGWFREAFKPVVILPPPLDYGTVRV